MPREHKSGKCHFLQAEGLWTTLDVAHFDPGYWHGSDGFRQQPGGRGGVCRIRLDDHQAVLRRYHRGGFVGKFLSDQYLWLGKGLSRPWREWKVLELARVAGLPVPEPLAACICRFGLYYRAALITAWLENTETLTARLERAELGAQGWYSLGRLIKRFHDSGIRHADLNSDNVLIDDEDRFYLIDFDRARVMKRLEDWQWRPLLRFRRSIEKRDRRRKLHFGDNDWQTFMDGYQS